MEPIISPWFMYLLQVIPAIQGVCIGFAVLTGVLLCVFIFTKMVTQGQIDSDYDNNDDRVWNKISKKILKVCLPMFIIYLTLALFLPSRKTFVGMYVTKHLTYDTVEEIIDAGGKLKDEFKQDILDLIDAIQGNEKSDNN